MGTSGKGISKNWTFWTHAFISTSLSGALALALWSYDPADPSFSTFDHRWSAPRNQLGYLGSWSADIVLQLFGYAGWIIPLFGIALIFIKRNSPKSQILSWKSLLSLIGILASAALLTRIYFGRVSVSSSYLHEGLLGYGLYTLLRPILGKAGVFLIALVTLWISSIVHFESWMESLLDFSSKKSVHLGKWILAQLSPKKLFQSIAEIFSRKKTAELKAEPKVKDAELITPKIVEDFEDDDGEEEEIESKVVPLIRNIEKEERAAEARAAERKIVPAKAIQPSVWKLPSLSMLTAAKPLKNKLSKSDLMETAKKITNTFHSFEIEGDITEITPGPILTVYEFQPGPGTRITKIVSVATDLAMALGVPAIRIVAPIPGKSVAGIEVPNPEREEIVLRDLVEISSAKSDAYKLPMCLGRDTEGKPVIEDLSKMPHLLVGGATSMGKSVLVNSMLTGLLCKFSPKDLRLIIVDPKLVEFKIYEDIPHLLLPIVNEAIDASKALKWAVNETKKRYQKMQEIAAKNLEAYNLKASEKADDPELQLERFPYIVIIIDELAELMLTAKKDVEQSIVRLTQLARAAGIHLIMATQRPSADVVTGLIKSNCPSRAALRVASSSDSRIILDTTGAELLLGKGDMFFTNSGPMGLKRLQGSFVSDGDVEKVCNFWREQGSPEYQNEILADPNDNQIDGMAERDELYGDVVSYAKEKGAISTSLIQRRFQIGYTRAARIMEQLEVAGVVGEQSSAGKPRDVLI